ncbi:hypothetical protein FRB94_000866 [Tulasnella sp. JGI-2019a]|nr:hypothetical protein FRB93_004352 [Tulasnella sp. JGI-2019a]KAG9006241.1 hypothetical protein FRB94_000866 [Tulasnella sp. JGI-2019a]KAG9039453.1 hypothetical protein FRB95_010742 [Tulasnella sp. JGI-2019a]
MADAVNLRDTFFAAGTLIAPLKRFIRQDQWTEVTKAHCQSLSKESASPSPVIASQLKQDLPWLIKHYFVHATWSVANNIAYLRIYIIPEDCEALKQNLYKRHGQLAKGTKLLQSLLGLVTRCPSAWVASRSPSSAADFFSEKSATRPLPLIYQQLPSPLPVEETIPGASEPYNGSIRLQAFKRYQKAMVSTLYEYQRRSLARMLEQELQHIIPEHHLESSEQAPAIATLNFKRRSPLFVSLSSIQPPSESGDGSPPSFFVDPARLIVRNQAPEYLPSRGGILSENMGTGKTVICIALILSTLNHLSQPPDTHISRQLTYTEWSLANSNSGVGGKAPFPCLVDIACHRVRTSARPLDWRGRIRKLPKQLSRQVKSRAFQPFYLDNGLLFGAVETERSQQRRPGSGPNKMYLTNATLLLVPKMLLLQWSSELEEHVQPGALRILTVLKDTAIPDAISLAKDFDLILMTHERLGLEAKQRRQNGEKFSITQVRWLRLIVDEGNVCANESAAMTQVRGLSAERRWIVTGTPTMRLNSESQVAGAHTIPAVANIVPTDLACFTEYRTDLKKLSIMIAEFLGISISQMIGGFHEIQSQSSNEGRLFMDHVATPLCASTSAQRWQSVHVLENMLREVIIRHRKQDIEAEVALPPIDRQIIRLGMDPYQAITYNVIQSLIVVNAIDSERSDQDYFFHPASATALKQVVVNLSQACFWMMDRTELEGKLEFYVHSAHKALEKARSRGALEVDIALVTEAYHVLQGAQSNATWRSMMRKVDLPIRVRHIPKRVQLAWGSLVNHFPNSVHNTSSPSSELPADPFFMTHVPDFRAAGDDCLLDEDGMIRKGRPFLQALERSEELDHAKTQSKTRWFKVHQEQADANHGVPPLLVLDMMVKPDQRCFTGTLGSLVCPDQRLLQARVTGSTSPKANFIVAEILRNDRDRFLIFSESPLSLFLLKEALDVARLPSVLLRNLGAEKDKTSTMANGVRRFEATKTHRAILMELKDGARGLNLTSANRVIFIEPVWQPDIESQAVKRVHRLGQRRGVTVQTLVMQDTAEEEMLVRRDSPDKVEKTMHEDGVMVEFIKNPRFIEPLQIADPRTTIDLPMFEVRDPSHIPSMKKRAPAQVLGKRNNDRETGPDEPAKDHHQAKRIRRVLFIDESSPVARVAA